MSESKPGKLPPRSGQVKIVTSRKHLGPVASKPGKQDGGHSSKC